MATFEKKIKKDGSVSYRARILIKQKGVVVHRESKSFSRESLAKTWAKRRESEIEQNIAEVGAVVTKATFGEVAAKYLAWLESQDALKRTKRTTIEFLMRQPIAQLNISKITSAEIIPYLRGRIVNDGAKPQTVNNDLAYIGSVMRYAETMLDIPVNLVELMRAKEKARAGNLVGRPEQRERRPTQKELEAILAFFNTNETKGHMADIVEFALTSARRLAEITRLRWDDLDEATHTIKVRDLKHPRLRGYTKTAKLTQTALNIIKRQPQTDEYIFPRNPKTVSTYFTRACHVLEIDDLRFHDLRHEATSRLFEAGYSIVEVQQFTLHENWATLKRYTHLRPEKLALR
ncbi:MAG: site-specific integrase [Thiomicrospira sp.]|jgi:integrase|nr:site-specific integrase [Thiomicrospira sp.]